MGHLNLAAQVGNADGISECLAKNSELTRSFGAEAKPYQVRKRDFVLVLAKRQLPGPGPNKM
jgi:hypothetical protein